MKSGIRIHIRIKAFWIRHTGIKDGGVGPSNLPAKSKFGEGKVVRMVVEGAVLTSIVEVW